MTAVYVVFCLAVIACAVTQVHYTRRNRKHSPTRG